LWHRTSPSDEEVEGTSGVLDQVLCLLVDDLRCIIAVDAEDDVTTVQLSISGATHKYPLYGESSFEILTPLESKAPRGGEGIPLQPDLGPPSHGSGSCGLVLLQAADVEAALCLRSHHPKSLLLQPATS